MPTAVRLWLRSQVEKVESLSLTLEGRDRQILSGYLPGVRVSSEQVIYQGIHINRLKLSAQDIRINIGQVIRGKPLRLLQVFPVLGEVALTNDDLNASLASPLLGSGLKDFWRSLVQDPAFSRTVEERYGAMALHPNMVLHGAQIRLGERVLALSFYPQVDGQTADAPVVLATGLSVIAGNLLQLEFPQWLETVDGVADNAHPIDSLQRFQWDLGKDTQLTQLVLMPEALWCEGQIIVNP